MYLLKNSGQHLLAVKVGRLISPALLKVLGKFTPIWWYSGVLKMTIMRRTFNHPYVFIVLAVVCATAMFLLQVAMDIYEQSTPRRSKREVGTSYHFNYLWDVDVFASIPYVGVRRVDDFIFIHENEITKQVTIPIVSGFIMGKEYLYSFDLASGTMLWQLELDTLGEFRSNAFAYNSSSIFAFMSSRFSDDHFNSVMVKAIDPQRGQVIWTKIFHPLNHIDLHYATDDFLSFRGYPLQTQSSSSFSLDVSTGEEIAPQTIIRSQSQENYTYLATKLGYKVVTHSITHENMVFLLIGDDSSIWVLDKSSEEVLGSIAFDGTPIPHSSYLDFGMQYSDGFLVVYFGDSHQLFTFRFDLETESD